MPHSTEIACDCGKFNAVLSSFPRNTPGRLVCYCSDCQTFLAKIGRDDLLDAHGGTEIIPAYPADITVVHGIETLECYHMTEKGPYRWVASCCTSPIANTQAGFPWAGLFYSMFARCDKNYAESLGDVRSRIYGRDAKEGSPFKISHKIGPGDMFVVLPFIVKGRLLKKHRSSPFFRSDDVTPICPVREL